MVQLEGRQIAFLGLCTLMVLVGAIGLVGWVSAGAGLIAAILIALVVVSISAGAFYRDRLA